VIDYGDRRPTGADTAAIRPVYLLDQIRHNNWATWWNWKMGDGKENEFYEIAI